MRTKIAEISGQDRVVPTEELVPNSWNPNKQTEEDFTKLVAVIRRFGFTVPIVTRSNPEDDCFEIIDGEHRLKAAKLIGMPELPIFDLGKVPDHVAQQLTIILNELSGEPDRGQLRNLIKDLSEVVPVGDLKLCMPFPEEMLDRMVAEFDPKPLAAITNSPESSNAALSEVGSQPDTASGKIKYLKLPMSPDLFREMSTKLAEVGGDSSGVVVKAVRLYHKEEMAQRSKRKAAAKKVARKSTTKRKAVRRTKA